MPSPSLPHELFIALFSHFGELARAVVSRELPQSANRMVVRSVSSDLSQLVPTQYLADHVLAFYEQPPANAIEEKHADLVIILESQLSVDETKHFTWPSYVANAARTFHCEAVLLVITDDPAVASWAKGPFGPSQMQLRPVVFCTTEVPQQMTRNEALENPLLAVLHALANPNEATAEIAFGVIQRFPDQLRELSFFAIMDALPDDCRKKAMEGQMEHRIESAVMNTWLGQWLLARGKEEGKKEGKEEGKKEGLAIIQGIALHLMRSKQVHLTGAEEEALSRADEAALTTLIGDLGLASEQSQLRAAVERLMAH